MHRLAINYQRLTMGLSLLVVFSLMAPTIVLVTDSLVPHISFTGVFENPIEEEREEERSSGEDEVKEYKVYTLPYQLSQRDEFDALAARQHAYELGSYISDLPIPYLPPEPAA